MRIAEVQETSSSASGAAGGLRRLLLGTLNYGVGSVVAPILGFFLIPLYTRLLDPRDFGVADFCVTLATAIGVVARLGAPGAVARFYFDLRGGQTFDSFVGSVTWFLLVVSGAIAALSVLVGPLLAPRLIPDVPFYPYLLIVLLGVPLTILPEMQRRVLQVREKAQVAAFLNGANALTVLFLTLAFVAVARWKATGLLLAGAVTALLFSLVAAWNLRRELAAPFRRDFVRQSLTFGLPLVPNHLSGWLLQAGNRAVLGVLVSAGALGEYSVASRFVLPVVLLDSAFTTAYVPIYFDHREREKEGSKGALQRLATLTIVGFLALGLLVFSVMPLVLRLVTPAEYHGGAALIPVIAIGAIAGGIYHVVGNEVLYQKRPLSLLPTTVTGGLVALSVTSLLAGRFGALGAALGYAAGMVATAAIGAAVNNRLYKFGLPMARLISSGIFVLTCAVVASASQRASVEASSAIAILLVVAGAAFLWVLFRRELTARN
ncbi:MAG: oligosaccharide flippase family protein [Holophagales bacterium]|nr:MAG: oligosaccharide flippase family protein [Holophagales bacterium]